MITVIWAAATDERLDAHIRDHRGHHRLRCAGNAERFEDDSTGPEQAQQLCAGCPIVRACREQALRQEAGAGASFGVRGGMTAAERERLIARRPGSAARTILPSTWTGEEVVAYLKERHGYDIRRNTWSAKAYKGQAPYPVYANGARGTHWDVRDVKGFVPKTGIRNTN